MSKDKALYSARHFNIHMGTLKSPFLNYSLHRHARLLELASLRICSFFHWRWYLLTSLDCLHRRKIFNQTFPAMTTCQNILTLRCFPEQKPYSSHFFPFPYVPSQQTSDPNELFHSYLTPENITMSFSNFSSSELQQSPPESFLLPLEIIILVRVDHEKHMIGFRVKNEQSFKNFWENSKRLLERNSLHLCLSRTLLLQNKRNDNSAFCPFEKLQIKSFLC